VVFYTGHGIEVDKRNFLISVEARPPSDADRERGSVPFDLGSRGGADAQPASCRESSWARVAAAPSQQT